MNKLLYIGLNGYAGSGKDTFAQILSFILNTSYSSKAIAYNAFVEKYVDMPVTHPNTSALSTPNCFCIAFADQLKKICSELFCVPLNYFYDNKSNTWICLNKGFEVTQIKPIQSSIVTASEYYMNRENYMYSSDPIYMSIRELLVYVGTYMLQQDLTKDVFINIVSKKIIEKANNMSYKYVICTDVRFIREMEFIHEHNGIMINITRDSVSQMNNIAEHELDNIDDFDFVIDNDGTIEDLFYKAWEIIENDVRFENFIIPLNSHDSSDNYLVLDNIRDIDEKTKEYDWILVQEYKTARTIHNNGKIIAIDPSGGPMINVGDWLQNISNTTMWQQVKEIWFDVTTGRPIIRTIFHDVC